MSTYLYLVCKDHEPPLEAMGESGQHTSDLPQIRSDIADRAQIVDLYSRSLYGMSDSFRSATAYFLSVHPACEIGIVDEYGREHSVHPDADLIEAIAKALHGWGSAVPWDETQEAWKEERRDMAERAIAAIRSRWTIEAKP
jgi:hypothetical protein